MYRDIFIERYRDSQIDRGIVRQIEGQLDRQRDILIDKGIFRQIDGQFDRQTDSQLDRGIVSQLDSWIMITANFIVYKYILYVYYQLILNSISFIPIKRT